MARRLILWTVGLMLAAIALAQSPNLLTRFGPVTGILFGTAGSPVTRAATASDIETLIGSTGTGSLVLSTSPTLVTPALGTPSALVLTNASGLPTTALPAFTGDCTTSAGSSAITCGFKPLTGTTGALGGSSVGAGACTSGTVGVTSSTTSMAVSATPAAYPGDGFTWAGYVSTAGTVTVKICNFTSGSLTPTSSAYNVRVLP